MPQAAPPPPERALAQAAGWLAGSRSPVALTGADLPPEPGPEPPETPLPPGDYTLEALDSPEGFRRWPRAAWLHALNRRTRFALARPGPAHVALVRLERQLGALPVITEAVDGLQLRAGSAEVIELHGSALRFRCSREGIVIDLVDPPKEGPPPCPRCGAPVRPDVVWVDEPIPEEPLRRAFDLVGECDLLIAAGTRGDYHPSGDLPFVAREVGARVILIAQAPGPLDADADLRLEGAPQILLPALASRVERPRLR